MPSPRKITNYFRRPDFALAAQDTRPDTPVEDPTPTSPLTDLSQLLPSDATTPETPDGPSSQLKRSLLRSTQYTAGNDPPLQSSFQSAGTGLSFGSSQRVVRKGKDVVISSDGDESDSTGSLEPPEELLSRYSGPTTTKGGITADNEVEHESSASGRTLRTRKSSKLRSVTHSKSAPPTYRNTLDDLVKQTVSDNDTEAGIAKLRASLNAESNCESGPGSGSAKVHEGVLASALDGGTDESIGLQRLLDAVRRTEAFDLGKSWAFFDVQTPPPPPPDFPRECICPGTYLAVLREPDSRERAFYSGVIDSALSRGLLPDELVRWIFHSIPSEPRDTLRYAYCRAIKRTTAERMKSLIQPEDIDTLFWRLSARPQALALSDPIVPNAHPSNDPQSQPQHHRVLISVLGIFRDAPVLFSTETRDRILSILLRLPLDPSLTRHSILCSEVERTITAVFEGITDDEADNMTTRICKATSATLKDAELQSHLLEHLLPTNNWIADLRRRLALIFLTRDPSAHFGSQDRRFEVNRITNILKDPQFDVRRYKRKGQPEYNYGKLRAITTFLNIIIDSGWSEAKFPDEHAEEEFNSEIDMLADRVKKIFTAIEDSGASHLSRTLAKEALESLHYRIVYSVRSKPPPKKLLFGHHRPEQKTQNILKFAKQKQVAIRSDKPDT
ncbi:uncharacterized protein BJX67DRAFT_377327 [Aspergillus lucknowensis]|uniref:Uncharacterized protein n=1 Tax=Aspergillus lucknowensis TaxID=176173 RepID=A0ABR4M4P5_9EURO